MSLVLQVFSYLAVLLLMFSPTRFPPGATRFDLFYRCSKKYSFTNSAWEDGTWNCHLTLISSAGWWKISYSCCSKGASAFNIPTLKYILKWADPLSPLHCNKRGHKVHPPAKTEEVGSSLMALLVKVRDGTLVKNCYLFPIPSTSPITPNLFPEWVTQCCIYQSVRTREGEKSLMFGKSN